MFFYVILKIIKKELIQTFSDKRMIPVLFVMPVFQILLFGYAADLDIKNISLAIYDQEKSVLSRELTGRFIHSEYFNLKKIITSHHEINRVLDQGGASAVLVIPPDFSRKIELSAGPGRNATAIQILLDGSEFNTANLAKTYSESVIAGFNSFLASEKLNRKGQTEKFKNMPLIVPEIRMLYNQSLKSSDFMVPGIIGLLLMLITMLLTALAITREREMGTMELLIVSPIKPIQIVLGKTIPYALVGMVDVAFIIIAGKLIFHVPIAGSLWLVFLSSLVFVFASLGLGLFVSSISRTQSQAILTMVFILAPCLILSGFMFPIDNMPLFLQYLTYLNPLRFFIELMRYLFLKNVMLWKDVLILGGFSLVIFTASALKFSKKLE